MPRKSMAEKAMECSSRRWCMCNPSLCTWRPKLQTLEWGYRTRDLLIELGMVVAMVVAMEEAMVATKT